MSQAPAALPVLKGEAAGEPHAAAPAMPAACRRQSALIFTLSLMPATACVLLALTGHWGACAAVFAGTFLLISAGTVIPRSPLFGPLVSRLGPEETEAGQVWITIDDGPDPETTPRLLDLLEAHGARAGFFLIGDRARAHPELVREIAARGHLIGNHSQTHPAGLFWILRPGRMWREIAGCQETLRGILGTAPGWFRPPVGHHNQFVAPILRALGLTMAVWNCRGFDGVEKHAGVILRRLSRGLRPGAIVLLHDGTAVCAEVLEGTLKLVNARGLKAVLPGTVATGGAGIKR